MATACASPEEMLQLALSAAVEGEAALHAALDALSAPIYLVDAEGWITYFNPACIDFAGRAPVLGEDRWCVTWKLYSETGVPLPHEHCPMAVAVKERREVRGAVALAERPDGTRVMFSPWPTPSFDAEGGFTGAVNILIDISDARQAGALRAQAMRCRRLARSMTDQEVAGTLLAMAAEYDAKAGQLDAR